VRSLYTHKHAINNKKTIDEKYYEREAMAWAIMVFRHAGYYRADLKEAIALLEEARQLRKQDISILQMLCEAHHRLGEFREEITLLEEILKIDPVHMQTVNKIANIYEYLGEYYGAIMYREHMAVLRPGYHVNIMRLNRLYAMCDKQEKLRKKNAKKVSSSAHGNSSAKKLIQKTIEREFISIFSPFDLPDALRNKKAAGHHLDLEMIRRGAMRVYRALNFTSGARVLEIGPGGRGGFAFTSALLGGFYLGIQRQETSRPQDLRRAIPYFVSHDSCNRNLTIRILSAMEDAQLENFAIREGISPARFRDVFMKKSGQYAKLIESQGGSIEIIEADAVSRESQSRISLKAPFTHAIATEAVALKNDIGMVDVTTNPEGIKIIIELLAGFLDPAGAKVYFSTAAGVHGEEKRATQELYQRIEENIERNNLLINRKALVPSPTSRGANEAVIYEVSSSSPAGDLSYDEIRSLIKVFFPASSSAACENGLLEKCRNEFKELIKTRLMLVGQNNLCIESLFEAMNQDSSDLFVKMGELKTFVVRPRIFGSNPQEHMCYDASHVFAEAFKARFDGRHTIYVKEGWHQEPTVGTTHYIAIIDDRIAVDMTYGQFDPAYKNKVLVISKKQLPEFKFFSFHDDEQLRASVETV
jgi:tetratricopeptide (TPR) repeat protein